MPPQVRTPVSDELRATLLKTIPHLRAFAMSLCSNVDQADDLVQETIVRALAHIDSFTPGTNMQAWLFTILRNQFHSLFRKRRREVEDPNGFWAGSLATPPEQHGRLDLDDLKSALAKLPLPQREILWLIGAQGVSYEEAAKICNIKVGTVKSRTNRARKRLAELLEVTSEDDLGADRVLQAAFTAALPTRRARQQHKGAKG